MCREESAPRKNLAKWRQIRCLLQIKDLASTDPRRNWKLLQFLPIRGFASDLEQNCHLRRISWQFSVKVTDCNVKVTDCGKIEAIFGHILFHSSSSITPIGKLIQNHKVCVWNSSFSLFQHRGCASKPLRRPSKPHGESRSLVAPRVEVPGDKTKTQKC